MLVDKKFCFKKILGPENFEFKQNLFNNLGQKKKYVQKFWYRNFRPGLTKFWQKKFDFTKCGPKRFLIQKDFCPKLSLLHKNVGSK